MFEYDARHRDVSKLFVVYQNDEPGTLLVLQGDNASSWPPHSSGLSLRYLLR
jgi:hypothetical protein